MRSDDFTGISTNGSSCAFGFLQPLDMMHLCTMHAKIHTDHGSMTVEFFEKDAPNTVANFIKLAKEGFYEGLKFHRVIPGFVAQGGCPQGIGNGGPGYTIDCELDGDNQHHDKGVLSMAHAGRNTGGSQFFLTTVATPWLNGNHAVFGAVSEGMDVVKAIEGCQKMPGDRPSTPQQIIRCSVVN